MKACRNADAGHGEKTAGYDASKQAYHLTLKRLQRTDRMLVARLMKRDDGGHGRTLEI